MVSSIDCFAATQGITRSQTSNLSSSLAIPRPQRGVGVNTHRYIEERQSSKLSNPVNWSNNNDTRTTTRQHNLSNAYRRTDKKSNTKKRLPVLVTTTNRQRIKWSCEIPWSSWFCLKGGVWGVGCAELVGWWTMVGELGGVQYHCYRGNSTWKFTVESSTVKIVERLNSRCKKTLCRKCTGFYVFYPGWISDRNGWIVPRWMESKSINLVTIS